MDPLVAPLIRPPEPPDPLPPSLPDIVVRVEALEQRNADLEARIAALEAKG